MSVDIEEQVKSIVVNSVGGNLNTKDMSGDFQLIGNLLDSMSITNLIVGIEEYYDIVFDDEDLSEEAFKNINSLIDLVKKKIG
jgi:acyl carrier protein